MRVGMIAPAWAPTPPARYGGIELVVDRLCRGLTRARHDVVLFATGDSTCPVERRHLLAHADGRRIGNGVTELRHALAAYESLRDAGCDVVHDHTLAGPIVAPLVAPGLPVVTTMHGPVVDELRDLYGRMARNGARLVAVSHAQARPAPGVPVAAVIHHGIDATDFPFGAGDGGYALFLGRMSADKGAHRAVEAAHKAGIPLLLAGKRREPAEHEYFEREVAPLLGTEAYYLGEVPHDEKLRLLAGAAALLFPIRWNEPFGLVMIEAMACGTPVVAFKEGAAPEVIDDGVTGFLCDDEADMACALTQLGRIERAACRRTVEARFSTDRMTREHVAVFERAVAEAS